MKVLITIAILFLVFLGAQSLLNQWKAVQQPGTQPTATSGPSAAPKPTTPAPTVLPGLPAHLEASLNAAVRQGPDALKTWLRQNRSSVSDPRLADIELDYVVMVGGKNFGEACDVLEAVRQRTSQDSPVYPKILSLQKTYTR